MFVTFRYLHWLSIDISVGAVMLLYFTSSLLGIEVPISVAIALGSSIWLVYTADHIRDVKEISLDFSDRRTFHQLISIDLIVAASLVVMVNLVNLFFLPWEVLIVGVFLSVLCVGYLLLTNHLGGLGTKEVFAAVIYSIGIFSYPLIQTGLTRGVLILLFQLALLACTNLLIMAYYESEEDKKDGFHSLATILGQVKLQYLIISLLALSVLLSAILSMIGFEILEFQLFYLISSLTLFGILQYPALFRNGEAYRWVADSLFLLPGLMLPWL